MIVKFGGEELAKVLLFYNLIYDLRTEQKILCPFHADQNPSLAIDLIEGRYFCFGCQKSGDAFHFVKEMQPELDDLHACLLYVQILNDSAVKDIHLSERSRAIENNIDLLNEAMDFYYGLKTVDWFESDDEDVIKSKLYMRRRGFKASTLSNCHAKITYQEMYPIVFPMLDNDEFKGWVCRTTSRRIEKKRKYLYNKGFSRATTLCGTYDNKSPVYIVEGYMDMLKMKQFGVRNVVAILGWKMTLEQRDKLKAKGITKVISALDNDECGKRGTTYLRTQFSVTRFKFPKSCKDPGDLTKKQFAIANQQTLKRFKGEK